jgi:hypothetical protein
MSWPLKLANQKHTLSLGHHEASASQADTSSGYQQWKTSRGEWHLCHFWAENSNVNGVWIKPQTHGAIV